LGTSFHNKAKNKLGVSKIIFKNFIDKHLKSPGSLEDRIKENYSKEPVGNETNRNRHEVFKKLAKKLKHERF
jgi:hypothetical protein